ncbi:MAG TPA: hypothetical protein PLU30_00100 [Verrucomicrobiae bacterium]|nr:hypothetical protein [Verrucomicrobiae bacterium]
MRSVLAILACALASRACAGAPDPAWLRPSDASGEPRWGLSNGIAFAIHPAPVGRPEGPAGAARGTGGPRGLIRVGYPILAGGAHALVNFIAIEPVVGGRRAFSELEKSDSDGQPGKIIEAIGPATIGREAAGVQRLVVPLRVESFRNGARVCLNVSMRSDHPDELRIAADADHGSAPIEQCILTATMGNLARARRLWLSDGFVECQTLYPGHTGDTFAPHTVFPIGQLLREQDGSALVAITTDEADPASIFPFPGTRRWHYPGPPVTQYWRKEQGCFRDDLAAVVNARATYWATQQPIPGGPAFENFEFTEKFRGGSPLIFGITRRTPQELGYPNRPIRN